VNTRQFRASAGPWGEGGAEVSATLRPAAEPEPTPDAAPAGRAALLQRRIRRLADALHAPLWQEAKALTQRHEVRQHEMWRNPPLDCRGMPVLLVGGMASTPKVLSPLQDLLHRYNCRCMIAPIKFGIGCGEATTRAVEHALARLVDATDEPAVIIAHSRGGQFSRAAAVRWPDHVRALITLGSPLNRLLAVHTLLKLEATMLGIGGTLGVPGLMKFGCLWGECCAPLRTDLAGPFPESVRFLSLFSRDDRVVDWRSCLDPAARLREVSASHSGMIWAPASLAAITEELAEIHAALTAAPTRLHAPFGEAAA
jgi:triacylglycerol lipase